MAYNIVNYAFIWNVIRTSASYTGRVDHMMQNAKLVPEVISNAPFDFLVVTYPSDVLLDLGNELTPREVKDEPRVQWLGFEYNFHTLCMIDADFPSSSRPYTLRTQWKHWLVGNIPGYEIDKGDTLAPYIGAIPSKESGLHRYLFLVYRQPSRLNFSEPRLSNKTLAGRDEFKISVFARKYQMGFPLAGNFFTARWDDYILEYYELLGKKTVSKGVK